MNDLVLYYFIVWLVSALAGLSRCIRNGDYESFSQSASIASVSGFLGFSIVAVISGDLNDPEFDRVFLLGVASLIGLAGKEQTQIITLFWKSVLARLELNNVYRED